MFIILATLEFTFKLKILSQKYKKNHIDYNQNFSTTYFCILSHLYLKLTMYMRYVRELRYYTQRYSTAKSHNISKNTLLIQQRKNYGRIR